MFKFGVDKIIKDRDVKKDPDLRNLAEAETELQKAEELMHSVGPMSQNPDGNKFIAAKDKKMKAAENLSGVKRFLGLN